MEGRGAGLPIVNSPLNALLGVPTKESANRSIESRIAWINAGDSLDGKNADRTNNCQRCVIAAELNARGYETTAMPRPSNDPLTNNLWLKALGNPTSYGIGGDNLAEATESMEDVMRHLPVGSRGIVTYTNAVVGNSPPSHVIMVEKTSRGPVFYDPQINKIFKNYREALTGLDRELRPGERRQLQGGAQYSTLKFMRTDTAKIDAEILKRYRLVRRF